MEVSSFNPGGHKAPGGPIPHGAYFSECGTLKCATRVKDKGTYT